MIRDDFIIKTKSFKHFGEEQGGNSSSVNGFLGRAENHPLSKPMVDHNQNGIKTIRKGKVGDQVIGDLLKWVGIGGWNGEKWGLGWVCIDFVLLAGGTPTDITLDIRSEAWPPKFRGNQLPSFENTGVTSSGMVMVSGNDGTPKVSVGRDIDVSLVSQNSSIIVPVREAGTESCRNLVWEGMESVND